MDNMRDTPQPQYLKMEDLQNAASPSTTVFDNTTGSQHTPATVIIHSKPAKKRKSWGQALPTPSTNLPPRKRAKTDDEKEQRRIERIKRNRAAAHNSRERKRQETEHLAVLLTRARAELDAYRRLHGPLPADVVLPEVTLNKDPESPGPLRYSDDSSSYMASPTISLLDCDMSIKQEPIDNTVSPMAMFEELDSKPSPLPTLDVTQHSAEMLCDLPCPSSRQSARTIVTRRLRSPSRTSSRQSLTSQACHAWWARLFIYHTHLHLQQAQKQILLAIWSISPSRMQALVTRALLIQQQQQQQQHQQQQLLLQQTSARISSIAALTPTTLSSSTISSTQTPSRLLRSTMLLAQLNAATSRSSQHARRSAVERRSSKTEQSVVTPEDSSRTAELGQDAVRTQESGVQEDR